MKAEDENADRYPVEEQQVIEVTSSDSELEAGISDAARALQGELNQLYPGIEPSNLEPLSNADEGLDSTQLSDHEALSLQKSYSELLEEARRFSPTARREFKPGRQFSQISDTVLRECHQLYEHGQDVLRSTRLWIQEGFATEIAAANGDVQTIAIIHSKIEKLVLDQIQMNRVERTIPGLGRVEVNSWRPNNHRKNPNDRIIFFRVVHERTGVSVAYADAAAEVQKLKHFHKWMARQHTIARRPALAVEVDELGDPSRVTAFPKPTSVFTTQFLRAKTNDIWEKPTRQDVTLAAVCVIADMSLMFCLDSALMATGMTKSSVGWSPYLIKIFFGMGIGSFAGSLQNWVDSTPRDQSGFLHKIKTVGKRSSVSLVFGIVMELALSHGRSSLSLLSMSGLFTWSYIFTNIIASNYLKDEALRWVDIRGRLRLNARSFGLLKNVSLKKVEAQTMRIATGFIRYFDLVLEQVAFGGHSEANVMLFLSRGFYFGSTLIPMYLNLKYFEHQLTRARKELALNPNDEGAKVFVNDVEIEVAQLRKNLSYSLGWFKLRLATQRALNGVSTFVKGIADYGKQRSLQKSSDQETISRLQKLLNSNELFRQTARYFAFDYHLRRELSDSVQIKNLAALFTLPEGLSRDFLTSLIKDLLVQREVDGGSGVDRIADLQILLTLKLREMNHLKADDQLDFTSSINFLMSRFAMVRANYSGTEMNFDGLVTKALGVSALNRAEHGIEQFREWTSACEPQFNF